MLIVLSADAVARRAMSGENLRHVIPRACARGIVSRGTKFRDFGFSFGDWWLGDAAEEREREPSYDRGEYVLDLVLDRDLDLERRRERDTESERDRWF